MTTPYLGQAFEEVAEEFLIMLNKKGALPFRFLEIGRWWEKGEEIDRIAFSRESREALFCEMKWKDLSLREAEQIVEKLREKAEKTIDEKFAGVEKEIGNVKEHLKKVDKKIDETKSGQEIILEAVLDRNRTERRIPGDGKN